MRKKKKEKAPMGQSDGRPPFQEDVMHLAPYPVREEARTVAGACLRPGGERADIPAITNRSCTMNRILLTSLIVGLAGLTGTAQAAGDAAAGKEAATSCAMCHGPAGAGTAMGTKIAGMDQAKFVQAMEDYKSGKRDNAMMKNQASQHSATDYANLAAYYASLK